MHLKLEQVTKQFGKQLVFKGINAELNPSESLAISGSNGSGKSTLLKIILGVLSPTSGKVRFQKSGVYVNHPDVMKHVGFCSPYLNLYQHLTAEENIRFRLNGLQTDTISQKIDHLFDVFKLSFAQHRLLKTFSSGMIQRTRLIQAFASDPEIVILDEPTATLDHTGRKQLYDHITSMPTKNKLLIIASNDDEDLRLCTNELNIENFKP